MHLRAPGDKRTAPGVELSLYRGCGEHRLKPGWCTEGSGSPRDYFFLTGYLLNSSPTALGILLIPDPWFRSMLLVTIAAQT